MTHSREPGPVVHLSVFTAKPGLLDRFIAEQRQGLPRFGDIAGWQGARLHRARDGRRAVLISLWDDEEAAGRFMSSAAFQEHRDRLRPLLESTDAGFHDLVLERRPGTVRDGTLRNAGG